MDLSDEQPLVSIVMPTHNRAELLAAAIRSVLNQTYDNFELIIVDDASSDNTEEVVKRFADDRIKYIKHDVNRGGSASRNTCLEHARGTYIAFLDDDDEWVAGKLEYQLKHLEENPEIGLVYCGILLHNAKSDEPIGQIMPKTKGNVRADLLKKNYICGLPGVLARKECFDACGMFDERFPSCQDWDLWLRFSEKYLFDYINEPLVKCLVQHESISTNRKSVLLGREMILEKYLENISQNKEIHGYHLQKIGILRCEVGDKAQGRQLLIDSIKKNPYNLTAVPFYLFSFLSPALLDWMIRYFKIIKYRTSNLIK